MSIFQEKLNLYTLILFVLNYFLRYPNDIKKIVIIIIKRFKISKITLLLYNK